MKRPLLFAMMLCCVMAAKAEDITVGNVTYVNATVTDVEPHELTISHETGIARVKLADCSPDMQAKFRYDPEAAASANEADAKARTQVAMQRARAESERLVSANLAKQMEETKAVLYGDVIDTADQGLVIYCAPPAPSAPLPKWHDLMSRVGGSVGDKRVRETVSPSPAEEKVPPSIYGEFLLVGHPDESKKARGDKIRVIAWRKGKSDFYTKGGQRFNWSHPLYEVIAAY